MFQKVKASDVRMLPYPHIAVENALPLDLYHRLEAAFPEDNQIYNFCEGPKVSAPGSCRPALLKSYTMNYEKQDADVWSGCYDAVPRDGKQAVRHKRISDSW